MGVSPDYACPVIVRIYSTRDWASTDFIDARALVPGLHLTQAGKHHLGAVS